MLRCINITSYETQTSTVGGCMHRLQSSNCLLAGFHAEVKSTAVPHCAPNLPKAIPINTKAVLKWKSSAVEAGCHSLCDCNIFPFPLCRPLPFDFISRSLSPCSLLLSLPLRISFHSFDAVPTLPADVPLLNKKLFSLFFFLPAPFHFC